MTKFENLKEAWSAFSRDSTFETVTAFRRACELATKRDLQNLAGYAAGVLSEIRLFEARQKATDKRAKCNGYSAEFSGAGKGGASC